MDTSLKTRIREQAEIAALYNAVKHRSNAEIGAIIGPLMAENPQFREYSDEVPSIVTPVIETINEMNYEQRRERLHELAPKKLDELDAEAESENRKLPDLPNAERYDSIRMRVAPNPNGPWHIGHARMAAVVGTYKQQYDGSFICRFDDTDPETKRPDLAAYEQIIDSIDYLGFEPDEVLRASNRLETYYEFARELIDMGGAYTCRCSREDFSKLKNNGEPCDHRDTPSEECLEEFEAMIDGEYSSGEIVLRIKTDIEHKNPALRDFVAFRMIDTPHPRPEAAEYRCWPMLDFQSGIDDHLTNVSHIIRGIDLQDSAKKQQFIYDYFGWNYPEVIHWGLVKFDEYDVPTSTSSIRELIETGELDGWDDPRAPTVMSLRRRGIRGEAIVEAMIDLGMSTSNVEMSMSSIYANNRQLIDDGADRAFMIRDDPDHGGGAVELAVVNGPSNAEVPVHPEHNERGVREIPVGDTVVVERADLPVEDNRIWLKGCGCMKYDGDRLISTDDQPSVIYGEGIDIIHWVPGDEAVDVKMWTMDGPVAGYAEPDVAECEVNEVVQFERIGFVRIDEISNSVVTYYAHR